MTDKIIKWLQHEQNRLQQEFYKKINRINPEGSYDMRCIHISVTCRCGNQVSTPFNMNYNGICSKCNKLFYRARK